MLILNSILLVLVIVVSLDILSRTSGNSVLSWFVLAISFQVGLVYTWLVELSVNYNKEASDVAYQNMGESYILFYLIALFFLVNERSKTGKRQKFMNTQKNLTIRSFFIKLVLIVSFIQLFFILTSSTNIEVLKNGFGVFGGSDYYDFRVILLKVGNEDAISGILARIKNLSRSINLIGFLLLYYNYKKNKYSIKGLSGLMIFVGSISFLDALLLFEKTPIMILIIGLTGIKYSNFFTSVSRITLAKFSILIFLFGNVLTIIILNIVQGVEIGSGLEFLYFRVFLVPPVTSLMHFDVYPDMLPHVEFSNIGLVRNIFNLNNKTINGGIGIDVAMQKTGLYYSANANTVASAWAHGGIFMVGFISIISCSIFFLIDRYIWRRRELIQSYPLVIYYAFWFIAFGNTSFENVILTSSLWFVPLVYPFFFKKKLINL